MNTQLMKGQITEIQLLHQFVDCIHLMWFSLSLVLKCEIDL